MSASSSNSSNSSAHQGSFVLIQSTTENPVYDNPDSPKSFIREINDDHSVKKYSEAPPESSTNSLTCTMDHTGVNNTISEERAISNPKNNRSKAYEEESHFARLCDGTSRLLQGVKNLPESVIECSVEAIIDSFRYYKGNQFSNVDLEKPENRCGFLCRYGPIAAGLTRHRVVEALTNCEELRSRLSVPSLKVVSLGSGPGCDIIGFCSGLYEFIKCKTLKFTLVDSVKNWISVFNVLEFLTREGSYGNASLVFQNCDISTTFLCNDLPGDTEQHTTYLSALKECDVILLSKLFSILTHDKIEAIKKTIVATMKVGAVLLFIDSPHNHRFENLKLIYLNTAPENYDFQGEAIIRFHSDIARNSKAQIVAFMKTAE